MADRIADAGPLRDKGAYQWWLSGVLPALVIGSVIGVLMGTLRSGISLWNSILGGSIIGLFCHTSVWILNSLFEGHLQKLPKHLAWPLRGLMYVIGGSVGFVIGMVLALRFVFGLSFQTIFRQVDLSKPVMMAAIIGLVIGIIAYTYHELKHRLEVSIARLKEHEFAEKELELARAVQARLLPPGDSEGEGYRIAARNLAAHYVAGDFYDIFPLSDGSVGVVVADVSGKGMAASLIMASVKASLPLMAAGKSVDQTLTALNAKLSKELSKREFVALAFAKFDPATGRVQVANAGLPDAYLLSSNKPAAAISPKGPRLPLGARASTQYEAAEVMLEVGERLILFSDGLPEATISADEQLGYDVLASMMSVNGKGTPGEWLDSLFASIRAKTSETLEDDWTALVLERS